MLVYLLVPALALLPFALSAPSRAPGAPAGTAAGGPEGRARTTVVQWLGVLLLVAFAGLRFDVGTDYGFYEQVYRSVRPEYGQFFLRTSPQESGFVYVLLALKSLSASERTFFLVTSAATILTAFLGLRRMSPRIGLTMLLFVLLGFYLAPFNILRQGIAVGLSVWAFSYRKERPAAWLVLSLLATTIHVSAVLALVAQLVAPRVRPSLTWLVAILGGGLVAVTLLPGLVGQAATAGLLEERYVAYTEGQASGAGTYLYLGSRLLLVLLVLRLRPSDGSADRFVFMSMIGLGALVVGTQIEPVARLELYFSIYLVVALPMALAVVRPARRVALQTAVVVGGLLFYLAYVISFGDLVPYRADLGAAGATAPVVTPERAAAAPGVVGEVWRGRGS